MIQLAALTAFLAALEAVTTRSRMVVVTAIPIFALAVGTY